VLAQTLEMDDQRTLLRRSLADAEALKSAGEVAAGEASLLSDAQGSGAYKRELLRVYIGRAVRQALSNSHH